MPEPRNDRKQRASGILASLGGACDAGLRLEMMAEIDSTNEALKRRATESDIHGLCLIAEQQTAGRGRLGKCWISPPESNLYLSLGWCLETDPAELGGLSLAIGAAIADNLESGFDVPVQLKWPNDMYLGGLKCGGILVELIHSGEDGCHVVVGVGLNIAMPESDSQAIDQPWTDLASHLSDTPSRDEVAGLVLKGLVSVLDGWQVSSLANWLARWSSRDFLKGCDVAVQQGGVSVTGRAAGVDPVGALLVETAEGVVSVHSGEASMLREVKQ